MEDKQENLEMPFDFEYLRKLLIDENIDEFREQFLALHNYDQATFYEKVGPDLRQTIYHYLSPEEMAEIYEAIEAGRRRSI